MRRGHSPIHESYSGSKYGDGEEHQNSLVV
jgi:hypothetical protein